MLNCFLLYNIISQLIIYIMYVLMDFDRGVMRHYYWIQLVEMKLRKKQDQIVP